MVKNNLSEVKEEKIIKVNFDLDKIIKKAQASYDKKEAGLARLLSTGKTIVKPTEDKDFVVWTGGSHWQSLTHLKGLPFGKAIQISGKPDSGKSTHAMCFMRMAQEQGVYVILWDAERKFSPQRFDNKMGGHSDQLLVVNSSNIIEGSRAVAQLTHAVMDSDPKAKILIVWDSAGSSINTSEDNEENENYSLQPGQSAKQISFAIKKFNKLANKYMDKETGEERIAILVINQTYTSIGFGPASQIEKGGTELYYLSSAIIQLSRKKDLVRTKDGQQFKFGIVSKCKVKKNHLFDGDECISQMDVVVSASGIDLAENVKKFDDIKGWDDEEEGEE